MSEEAPIRYINVSAENVLLLKNEEEIYDLVGINGRVAYYIKDRRMYAFYGEYDEWIANGGLDEFGERIIIQFEPLELEDGRKVAFYPPHKHYRDENEEREHENEGGYQIDFERWGDHLPHPRWTDTVEEKEKKNISVVVVYENDDDAKDHKPKSDKEVVFSKDKKKTYKAKKDKDEVEEKIKMTEEEKEAAKAADKAAKEAKEEEEKRLKRLEDESEDVVKDAEDDVKDLEDAVKDGEASQEELDQALAVLAQAEADLEQAKQNLKDFKDNN